MSQRRMVLDYILDHGGITPKEAEDRLGVMRLASRIYELKEEGYPIESEWETGKNRFGIDTRYRRYTYGKEV